MARARLAVALVLALAAAPAAQQAPAVAPPAAPPAQQAPAAPAPVPPAEERPRPVLGSGAGPAAKAFEYSGDERFEFHARGLPVADVFAELRRLVRRNIIVAPDVTASFTGDLYSVTTDEIVSAICRSAGLVARNEGSFLYVELDKPETRVYTLRHARADDIIALVRPLLSAQGQVSGTPAARQGIVSSQDESGGNDYAAEELIVVRDVASRFPEVEAVVNSMDALPRQVLIEATILSVTLNDQLQFGVSVSALAGVDWSEANGFSTDGQDISAGPFTGSQLTDGLGAATSNVSGLISQGGLNVGLISDSVAVFVRALQSITEATVLANPRVITMNKQRGEVLLGRRDGYLTTTVTQTSSTQKIEYLETGTRLVFRPYISGDGMVRLEIHPEDSNGGLNSDGLPFKDTAEVTTNVLVKSGQTVVIGGLFRERDTTTERKVPILGDIPVLGWLFRSEDTIRKREEIVIVLTPTVIDAGNADDWGAAGLQADELRQQVDRLPRPTAEALAQEAAAPVAAPASAPPAAPDAASVARAWFGVVNGLAEGAQADRATLLLAGLPRGVLPAELQRRLQAAVARAPQMLELDRLILAQRGLTMTDGGARPTTIDDLARNGWVDGPKGNTP